MDDNGQDTRNKVDTEMAGVRNYVKILNHRQKPRHQPTREKKVPNRTGQISPSDGNMWP